MLVFTCFFFQFFTLKPLFPTNRCGDGMEVGDAGVNRALHCKLMMQKVRLTLVEVLFDGLLISVSICEVLRATVARSNASLSAERTAIAAMSFHAAHTEYNP